MASLHQTSDDSGAPGRSLAWVDPAAAAREAQALLDDLFAEPLSMTPPAAMVTTHPAPTTAPALSGEATSAAEQPEAESQEADEPEDDLEWPEAAPDTAALFDDADLLLDLSDFDPFERLVSPGSVETPMGDYDRHHTALDDRPGTRRRPRWEQWASPAERRDILNKLTEQFLTTAAQRGFITLHELARAAAWLRYDEPLLDELCARLDAESVCATEAVAHTYLRGATLDGILARFSPLFARQPNEYAILRRLGYTDVADISPGMRAFMVRAFILHQLTRAEEEALVRTMISAREGGDGAPDPIIAAQARQAIFDDNLSVAVRIARLYQGQGLPIEDLIQEGCLGLYHALDRYELGKTNRFMQYGAWWITQRITRAIADTGRTIRLPVHLHEEIRRLDARTETLSMELGRTPEPGELAAAMEIGEARLAELLNWRKLPMSLDALEARRPGCIERLLARDYGPDDDLSARTVRDDLMRALQTLKPRDRQILLLRCGFTEQGPMTLEEVGQRFGLTRERIRQVEKKSLERLQRHRALQVWAASRKPAATATPEPRQEPTKREPIAAAWAARERAADSQRPVAPTSTTPHGTPTPAERRRRAAIAWVATGAAATVQAPQAPTTETAKSPKSYDASSRMTEGQALAVTEPATPMAADNPAVLEPSGLSERVSARSHATSASPARPAEPGHAVEYARSTAVDAQRKGRTLMLGEIGKRLQFTIERVRQLEKRARDNLRQQRSPEIQASGSMPPVTMQPPLPDQPARQPAVTLETAASQHEAHIGATVAPASEDSPSDQTQVAPQQSAVAEPIATISTTTLTMTEATTGESPFMAHRATPLVLPSETPSQPETAAQPETHTDTQVAIASLQDNGGGGDRPIAASAPPETSSPATAVDAAVIAAAEHQTAHEPLLLCPELLPRKARVSLLDELLFVHGLVCKKLPVRRFIDELFAWPGLILPKGESRVMLARNALDLYFALGLIEPTRLDALQVTTSDQKERSPTVLFHRCAVQLRNRVWGMADTYTMLARGDTLHADELARQLFHAQHPAEWQMLNAQRQLTLLAELGLVSRRGTGNRATPLLDEIEAAISRHGGYRPPPTTVVYAKDEAGADALKPSSVGTHTFREVGVPSAFDSAQPSVQRAVSGARSRDYLSAVEQRHSSPEPGDRRVHGETGPLTEMYDSLELLEDLS